MTDTQQQPRDYKHKYFDPPIGSPEMPEEVLGIPTEPITRIDSALGTLGYTFRDAPVPSILELKEALRLYPLVERVQSGEKVEPEDVRPYRRVIKEMAMARSAKIQGAETYSVLGSILLVGIPARRLLNRRIEEEFPKRIPKALDTASSFLPQAQPYVDAITAFDNPRDQFISELALITHSIRKNARTHAQKHNNTKVITANDAAVGITLTIEAILTDKEATNKNLPLLAGIAQDKLPDKAKLPSTDMLAIAAPEIMQALDTSLPEDMRDSSFISSIMRHPHPKRSLAVRFRYHQLDAIKYAVPKLILGIHDLLPSRGNEVDAIYERVKKFLKTKPMHKSS